MPNPLSSFGPPDIFQTQANTYQNSFQNPINSANMNGGWGIDPNLLTPSYQAPYRPQYSGEQPYNQYGRVGFFGGMNQLFNPLVPEPTWGNPVDHAQASIEGVSGRPIDAAAWTGQRVIAPALAFGGAYRLLGPRSFGGYFTGQGLAAGMGRSLGSGIGRGLAGALGMGRLAGAVGGAFGVAGSIAGGIALPYAVASGAMKGAEKAIFNPYINSRQAGMDLRRNFAGVNFSDATGNAVTGGGLGYQESNRMGSQIMHQGIQDMSFSTSEYTNIADMSARAGLLDNVKARDITKRVKDVAEQIKLIMAISKDPDIKNAVEELSKLNMGGADLTGGRFSTGAGAYQNLGRLASQAGVSVQRLMNTAGAQGQYLFQSNGMTPYLGQLAAGNAFAGFAASQRIGMLSPAQLARMGGVEGATQASLTGQLAAAQTPYNMMALYNQYIGGMKGSATNSAGQSLTNTVTAFGAQAARDPLGAIGGMQLYGRQMVGNQIANQGALAVENQVVSLMESQNAPKGRNGKYSAEQMVPYLTHMGMSQDDILAFIAQRAGETDPEVAAQRARGLDRYGAEQTRQVVSQDFAYGGWIGSSVRGVKKFGRNVTSAIAGATVDPVMEAAGFVGDKTQSLAEWAQFGSTLTDGLKVSDTSTLFQKEPKVGQKFKTINPSLMQTAPIIGNVSNDSSNVIGVINKLAKDGDAQAIDFLNQDPAGQRKALGKLIRDKKELFGSAGKAVLNSDDPQAYENLLTAINTSDRKDYTLEAGVGAGDKVTKAFKATVGDSNVGLADSMQIIGAAYDIEKQVQSGKYGADNIDELLSDKRYGALKRQLGNRTGGEALGYINDVAKRAAKEGTIGISNDAFNSGATLEAYKKDGGKGIADPKLRQEFQKALSAGDEKTMNQIVVRAMADKGGGRVLNQGVDLGNQDVSEYMKVVQPMIGSDEQKAKLMDLVKSGRVDFASAMKTINSLDEQKTTKQFSDAVNKFDAAVEKIGGKEGKEDSGRPWWLPQAQSNVDMVKQAGSKGPK